MSSESICSANPTLMSPDASDWWDWGILIQPGPWYAVSLSFSIDLLFAVCSFILLCWVALPLENVDMFMHFPHWCQYNFSSFTTSGQVHPETAKFSGNSRLSGHTWSLGSVVAAPGIEREDPWDIHGCHREALPGIYWDHRKKIMRMMGWSDLWYESAFLT